MKASDIAWALVGVWAAVCVAAGVEAIEGPPPNYQGPSGSHGHMRQHVHVRNHNHRHHTPRKHKNDLPTAERNDPKRMPKETLENPTLLRDNDLFHDREHLKEELPDYMHLDKIQEMSEKELDFHYFRMHDFDNNFQLDGLEILAALGHVVGEEEEEEEEEEKDNGHEGEEGKKEKEGDSEDPLKGLTEDEKEAVNNYRQQVWEDRWKFFIELVDGVMDNNDLDNDGLISWREFLKGRRQEI